MELWVNMARFCIRDGALQLAFPVQHGMVGIHVPVRRLRGQHNGTGRGTGRDVLQGLWNGMLISSFLYFFTLTGFHLRF